MAEGWAMDWMEDGITLRPKWEKRVNLLHCLMPSGFFSRHSLRIILLPIPNRTTGTHSSVRRNSLLRLEMCGGHPHMP